MTEKERLYGEFAEEDFEKLDITDDFLFYSTLSRNMELCRQLLEISKELKDFLEYLVTRNCNSEFTKSLDDEVWAVVENEEWRLEYMTLRMRDRENLERGLEQGLATGRKEGLVTGRKEGESRVNILNLKLAEAGREAEIVKAATDKEYQEKLFKEFDL